MYCILEQEGESRERRDQLGYPAYQKPELPATAPRESAELAKQFIEEAIVNQVPAGQLTIHADRGRVMKSKPVAFSDGRPGRRKSQSRPYVSDDNPYSES